MESSSFITAVISHSPPHTEDSGGSSDGVSIDSLSIGVGVACALLVLLTTLPVILITVLVCLRRRRRRSNKLSTTENVAYLYSNTVLQTNVINSLAPQDGSYPCISTSSDVSPTQNEVYNGHTSSNDVTGICVPTFTNQAYLEVGNNDSTSNTDIVTSTNQAYVEVSNIGHTSNTDIVTSTNPAYFEDDSVYEDTDIPTSTNQSYLIKSCQSGSDSLTYDYIRI